MGMTYTMHQLVWAKGRHRTASCRPTFIVSFLSLALLELCNAQPAITSTANVESYTTVKWTPSTPAPSQYYIYGTRYAFTESLIGGVLDSSWVWDGPACQLQPHSKCGYSSTPSAVAITVNGLCDLNVVDGRGTAPALMRPEHLDGRSDWSAEVFLDNSGSNGGALNDNTAAGLVLMDVETGLPLWSCHIVSYNAATYRECKAYNTGGRTVAHAAPVLGRGWIRLSYNFRLQRLEVSGKNVGETVWGTPTIFTLAADLLLPGGRYLNSMRVGVYARSWRPSGVYTFQFLNFTLTVTDTAAVDIAYAVPGTASSANISLPYYVNYALSVAAVAANGDIGPRVKYAPGVSQAPFVKPLPVNTSDPFLRFRIHVDFSQERGGSTTPYVRDNSGWRNYAAQTTASLMPTLVSNYLGPHTAWVAAANSYMDLSARSPWFTDTNIGSLQTSLFIVARGNTGAGQTAALYTKGGYTDSEVGFGIWYFGSPPNINFKVRAKSGTPWDVNVAGIVRTAPIQTSSPTVWGFRTVYDYGCHWRRLLGYENDETSLNRPFWFATAPTPWVEGQTYTDADGMFRAGIEMAPCTYTSSCQVNCSYTYQNPGNAIPVRIGASPAVMLNANQFSGEIYEVIFFGEKVPDTALTAVRDHLMTKYFIKCPQTLHPTANMTATFSVCSRGVAGSTCTVACTDPSALLIAGSFARTCSSGAWGPSSAAICSRQCPTLPRPTNAATCTAYRLVDSFLPAAGAVAGTEMFLYSTFPQMPYDYAFNRLFRVSPVGLAVDTTSRWNLPQDASLAVLYVADHIWRTQTSQSSNVTVSASLAIMSGGAGLCWRMNGDATGGMSYYRLVLTPSADGLPHAQVIEKVSGSSTAPSVVSVSSVNARILLGSALTVSVSMMGGTISTLLNGAVLHSAVTDPAILPHGDVGLVFDGTALVTRFAVTTPCDGGDVVASVVGGTGVEYSCPAGYAVAGTSLRFCNFTGAWGGTDMSCMAIPPVFTPASMSITENSSVDAPVGLPLNASSTLTTLFYIVSGDPAGAFKIDACGGQIRVARNILDYESQSSYTLTVSAVIADQPSVFTTTALTIAVLNVNEPPVLVTTSVLIGEAASVGSFAAPTLLCSDPENDPCVFSFSPGFTTSIFSLQQLTSTNAVVVLNASGVLDYETVPFHLLSITVSDASVPSISSAALLRVTVLNSPEAPVIVRDQVITIREAEAASASVAFPVLAPMPISVYDSDTGDTFTLELVAVYGGLLSDGTAPRLAPTGIFVVNATSAQISLVAPVSVADPTLERIINNTYVTRAAYRLTVTATDSTGRTSTANITVVIPVDGAGNAAPYLTGMSLVAQPDTTGGDTITIVGQNFDALVASGSTVVLQYGSYTTATCNKLAAEAFEGGQPDRIICFSVPGIGSSLAIALFVDGVRCRMAYPFTFSYGPPQATAMAGLAPGATDTGNDTLADPMALSTRGGETIYIIGSRFGIWKANVSAWYGPLSHPKLFTCTVLASTHTSVTVSTAVGAGAGFMLTVAAGNQQFTTGLDIGISYARPSLASVSGATAGVDATSLLSEGGQQITLHGDNFGPFAVDGLTVTPSVTFGYDTLPERQYYTAQACYKSSDLVATHTTIMCTVPPGVGAGMYVFIKAVGQVSLPAPQAAALLSYEKPTISRVSGPGAEQADTVGGQLISIEGRGFGPPADNGVVTVTDGVDLRVLRGVGSVTYGPYTACACVVIRSTLIECLSAPGTGSGHLWSVRVAGQSVGSWMTPSSTRMSYGQPIVYSFSGVGARNASTVGGQSVVVEGRNFGAIWNNTTSRAAYLWTGDGTTSNLTYAAAGCMITTAHTQLTCVTAEGAGAALSWTVVVDGLASSIPLTSYGVPIIQSVGASDGSVITAARAGDWVHVTGVNFGKPGNRSSWVEFVRYGPTSSEYLAPVVEVLTHSRLRFRVGGGFGTAMRVLVSVAQQLSGASESTFAIAPPTVTSVLPRSWSTNPGNLVLTITGTGFALEDTSAGISLTVGNAGDASNGRALIPLSGTSLGGGMYQVTLSALPGVGPNRAVRVLLFRRDAPTDTRHHVYSDPIADTPGMLPTSPDVPLAAVNNVTGVGSFFSYTPPVLASVVVSIPRSAAELDFIRVQLGCTDVTTYCGYRILQLNGDSFGVSPSEVSDNVRREIEFADFDSGTLTQVSAWPWMSWSHTMIAAATSLTKMRVRVRITSKSVTGIDQITTSAFVPFQALSPSVSGLVGSVTDIPTTGGTLSALLRISAASLDKTKPVRVTIGPNDCTLYDATGTTALSATQAAAQLVGDDGGAILPCRIPPGQGSVNPIVILRLELGEWKTSAIAADFSVSYAPPSIGQVGVQAASLVPGAYVMRAYAFGMEVKAATDATQQMRIVGSNFGLCPIVSVAGRNTYFCSDSASSTVATQGTTHSHHQLDLWVPAGEGANLPITITVGDQSTSLQPLTLTYDDPAITSCRALSLQAGLPTIGGARVVCTGRNLGAPLPNRVNLNLNQTLRYISPGFAGDYNDPYPPVVMIQAVSPVASDDGLRPCFDVLRTQYNISCVVPEGEGGKLDVSITVANAQPVRLAGVFSYDPPVITSIDCSNCLQRWSMASSVLRVGTYGVTAANATRDALGRVLTVQPPTDAGSTDTLVTLHGHNFGLVNARGSGSGATCVFLLWTARADLAASIVNCDGLESFVGEGEVNSGSVYGKSHTQLTFRVPSGAGTHAIVVSVRGSVSTRIGAAATLAYAPPEVHSVSPAAGAVDGGTRITIRGRNFHTSPIDTSMTPITFPPTGMPISTAAMLPTVLLRVDMHRGCVSEGRAIDGSVPRAILLCRMTVISRSHTEIVLFSAPGIGVNRTLNVSLIEPAADGIGAVTTASYPPFPWSFEPPTITLSIPQLVVSRGASDTAVDLSIAGDNFGRLEDAMRDGWTSEEQAIEMHVAGIPCTPPPTRGSKGSLQVIQCTLQAQTAGPKNVTLLVAGQPTFMNASDENAPTVVCDHGYTGGINQDCIACPMGAECVGYNRFASTVWSRFADPSPQQGYYNLNETDGLLNCPASARVSGRSWCIVPCEPSAACLGNNECSEGYASLPPMYRCSSCAKGYFRRASECIKCPDSPVALAIGFVLVIMSLAGAGYILNKKQIQVAFVTIAVDYFQVVSIFLSAKVPWPPQIKQLLYMLSAFNLNIEIVAPECIVPEVSYSLKFGVIVLLPVALLAFLGVLAGAATVWKWCILRQKKRIACTHSHATIATGSLLMYFFFLYLTRTSLDTLNCVPTTPPTYDDNGKLITYMAVVFEECYKPGGTFLALLPWAILTLCLYSFGYPLFLAVVLWRNRYFVMQDQLLRAKGMGDSKLDNPEAYAIRQRWHRSYYTFKPDAHMWILAVLLRKFGIAVTAIIFNRNAAFQLAACMMVMFLAYAAQVRVIPYMSPSEHEEVLKSHEVAAFSSPMHAKLKAALSAVEVRGRKRTKRNMMTADGKFDRSAFMSTVVSWLYNYNTAEAVLLFSTVIILMMALMYLATTTGSGAQFYGEARDSITGVVIAVIAISIVYVVMLVITEVFSGWQDAAARDRKSRPIQAGIEGGRSFRASLGARKSLAPAEFNAGLVQSSTNPMHLAPQAGGGGTGNASDSSPLATLILQSEAPTQELWVVFKHQFSEQQVQLKEMQKELADARRYNTGSTSRPGSSETEDATASSALSAARQARKSRTEFVPRASITPSGVQSYGSGSVAGATVNPLASKKQSSPAMSLSHYHSHKSVLSRSPSG